MFKPVVLCVFVLLSACSKGDPKGATAESGDEAVAATDSSAPTAPSASIDAAGPPEIAAASDGGSTSDAAQAEKDETPVAPDTTDTSEVPAKSNLKVLPKSWSQTSCTN